MLLYSSLYIWYSWGQYKATEGKQRKQADLIVITFKNYKENAHKEQISFKHS